MSRAKIIVAGVLALYASAHVAFAILRPADAWVYLSIATVAVIMVIVIGTMRRA